MKIIIAIICSILMTVTFNAQKLIYIRPLASMKLNNSFYPGASFKSPLDVAGNEYYSFYNYGLHANTTQLNLGLSVGLKLSNLSAFEFSLASDNASIKSAFVYKTPNYSSSLIGRSLVRISADYHRLLYTNKLIDLRGTVGFGLFLTPKQNNDTNTNDIIESNFSAAVVRTVFNYNRISPLLKLGTGLDFKTKMGKPFCSLDVFLTYKLGKPLLSESYNVTVTDNSQQISTFQHTLSSKGSGINFQLSFPIQVYSFGTKKSD